MTAGPKRIRVDPASELARLLDQAARTPLLLEKGGVTYRLTAELPPDRAPYDPRAAIASMRSAAGSWADVNADTFKAQLYRAREDGTKPDTSA